MNFGINIEVLVEKGIYALAGILITWILARSIERLKAAEASAPSA